MPPSVGIRANIELARISGYIVCETYGIAPRCPKTTGSEASIDVALRMLRDWETRLPLVLQIPDDQTLLDPACCTMHMGYNQLIILTTRPIFFAVVRKVVAQRFFSEFADSQNHLHKNHFVLCTEAAQRNLELARLLQSTNQNWLQSGLHFLFNAAVILLLNRIGSVWEGEVGSDQDAESSHTAEIGFAIHIFEQEAKTGTNFPRDCCKVLQDLKALTDHYVFTQRTPNQQRSAVGGNSNLLTAQSTTAPHQHPHRPDSSIAFQEMMNWAQTDGLQLKDTLLV